MASETRHPEPSALEAFATGRLDSREMEQVESHLANCPACGAVALATPMDHLGRLLRRAPRPPGSPRGG